MPFVGTISNQSAIRSGANFTRHLIVHTPDVVCQVQPSANASGLSNASITLGTPSIGSIAAIKSDYTVFITPTSDYKKDLQRLGSSEYLITYARNDGNGSTLDIGNTTFQWSTSQYVTVVKDVRVHQRKLRYDSNAIEYRDYDISWRKPKPRINGLETITLEITSGSTVSKSFTPSADAMAGGTISSWLWDVDGNTISTGTTSTQNITVDFTAGTHLISLTVTNSDGISNKLSVVIYVIPRDYNSVLETGIVVSTLSHGADGHVCGFDKYSDISDLLPGSMAVVCTKVHFGDGTTKLTTDMVGWLGGINAQVVGDETWQRLQYASVGLLDVGYLMTGISLQSLPFELNASPSAWSHLASCTPLDMAWSIISEQSTVANVAAIDFESTYSDQTVKSYDTPNGTLIDIMRTLAFNNNAGSLQFAPHGEIVFDVSLPYSGTSVRDAADTVVTLSYQDANEFNLTYPSAGVFAVQYVNAGATRYSSTQAKMRNFYGRAPAEVENGILEERIEYMVFPADGTTLSTTALVGRLAYNHWAAINENLSGSLDGVLGGYLELRQQENTWLKLSIAEGELPNSDLEFGSSDRFMLTSVSQDYDVENGRLFISLQIRKETGNTDNYSVLSQELFAAIVQASLGVVPNVPAYPLLDGVDNDDVYGDSYSDSTAGMPDPADEPTNNGVNNNDPSAIIETLQIPLTGQTVTTTNTFTSENDYLITLYGKGVVGQSTEVSTVTFDTGGYANYTVETGTEIFRSELGSIGVNDGVSAFPVSVVVLVDLQGAKSVTSASMKLTGASGSTNPNLEYRIEYANSDNSAILYDSGYIAIGGAVNDTVYTRTISESYDNVGFVRFYARVIGDTGNSKRVSFDDLVVNTGGGGTIYGDSMFKIESSQTTAWGGAAGMQFNGGNIALASVDPSAYATDNTYTFTASIAGAPTTFNFNFVDSDGVYSDNSGSITAKIETIT